MPIRFDALVHPDRSDADYIIGPKTAATAKLVKSSVAELKDKLDKTTKALMHIKVGLAEKGYTANNVVRKVPGGASAVDSEIIKAIRKAEEAIGIPIVFEDVVRISPMP